MNADGQGLNQVTYAIIGAAQRVSRTLGAGFSEKIYENALCIELAKAQRVPERQRRYQVLYDAIVVGEYVPDLIVASRVIVEIKALETLGAVQRAQCINYLRATGLPLCLLLNFGRPRLEFFRFALTR